MFVCPICHTEGEFRNGIFICSHCNFSMKDTISSHKLTENELSDLSSLCITNEITDFVSKAGKTFSGRILALPQCCTILFKPNSKNIKCTQCNAQSEEIYENNQIVWCSHCHSLNFKEKPLFGLDSDCEYPIKQTDKLLENENSQNTEITPQESKMSYDNNDLQNDTVADEDLTNIDQTNDSTQSDSEYYDVFISHSSIDNEKVFRIYNFLIDNGYRCWLDKACIPAGNTYTSEIGKGLQSSALFLCVMSKNANSSKPVRDEAIAAYNNKKPMLVYSIDPDINVSNLHHEISLQYGGTQWICNYGKDDLNEAKAKLLGAIGRLLAENKEKVEELKLSRVQGQQQSPIKPNIRPALRRVLINFAVMLSILVTSFYLWDYLMVSGIITPDPKKPLISISTLSSKARSIKSKAIISEVSGIKIGSVLQMGSYLNEPINWVYVYDDNDGNQVFLAQQAVTFKVFDNAHSNTFGKINNGSVVEMLPSRKDTISSFSKKLSKADWIKAFGDSNWEQSSIRAWLNSDEITVKYPTVKPTIDNINAESANMFGMTYLKRFDEPGFLKCFTTKELELLKPTKNLTILTDYHKKSAISGVKLFNYFEAMYNENDLYKRTMMPRVKPFIFDFVDVLRGETEDLVVLPSLEEFINISQNPNIQLDYSKKIFASNGEEFWLPNMTWSLRTPCGFLNTTICSVIGANVNQGQVALLISNVSDVQAIRPMIRMSIKDLNFSGDGTPENPLQINF